MFSALACVAFAFSGFASNETSHSKNNVDVKFEKEFNVEGTKCYFRVCITDSKGTKTCTPWTEIECSAKKYDFEFEQKKKIEPSDKGSTGVL